MALLEFEPTPTLERTLAGLKADKARAVGVSLRDLTRAVRDVEQELERRASKPTPSQEE